MGGNLATDRVSDIAFLDKQRLGKVIGKEWADRKTLVYTIQKLFVVLSETDALSAGRCSPFQFLLARVVCRDFLPHFPAFAPDGHVLSRVAGCRRSVICKMLSFPRVLSRKTRVLVMFGIVFFDIVTHFLLTLCIPDLLSGRCSPRVQRYNVNNVYIYI